MTTYGKPIVEYFGEGALAGWTVIQLITTSNINLHAVPADNTARHHIHRRLLLRRRLHRAAGRADRTHPGDPMNIPYGPNGEPAGSNAWWKKASKSNGNGGNNCVEVMFLSGGGAAVRDSKNPDGPRLNFTKGEWDAFLDGAQNHEFDNPDS